MLPTTFSRGAESVEDEQQLFEAAPQGDPTGLTIAFAAEVAAQAGQMPHELLDGEGLAGLDPADLTQHIHLFGRDRLDRRTVWVVL